MGQISEKLCFQPGVKHEAVIDEESDEPERKKLTREKVKTERQRDTLRSDYLLPRHVLIDNALRYTCVRYSGSCAARVCQVAGCCAVESE